jgi:hypothetical protein
VLGQPEWAQAATLLEKLAADTLRRWEEPALASLLLAAPGGATFRITVDDAGVLVVSPVLRT